MKRIIFLFFAVVMITTVFASIRSIAFADDLVNEIKDNYISSKYGPSSKDIMVAESGNEIQFPQSENYYDDYTVMYVNAPKKLCAYVRKKPDSSSEELPYAYQGSKVIALAEESGYCCVLYTTKNNIRNAGWIKKGCLTNIFPGDSYNVGDESWLDEYFCVNYGDASTSWSKDPFVGTKVLYTKIDSLPSYLSECRGMTVEYKITGRGTNDDRSRQVYVNFGDGWNSYGTFTIDKDLSPVRINLYFEEPVTVKGVAIVPTNPNNYDFSFRQTVVDVMYDYSFSPGAWYPSEW